MRSSKKRYGMAIDTKLCMGCGACVMACKTENEVAEGLHRVWVVEEVSGKFPDLSMEIRSERCNHCSNAPCVSACPTGASYTALDSNIVRVDPGKCAGCKACMAACPYNARYITPEGYAGKCTFCSQRVAENLDPACASVCPTRCIEFGDMENPRSGVSKKLKTRKNRPLLPRAGTGPNIFYLS